MFTGVEPNIYHQLVGACHAYEVALTLIDQIDLKQREIDEHSRTATSTTLDANARSNLALFGSSYWGRKSNT